MTYGHSPRAFIENAPVIHSASREAWRSHASTWRALDPDRRIALIEQALSPANDIIDGFPLAL